MKTEFEKEIKKRKTAERDAQIYKHQAARLSEENDRLTRKAKNQDAAIKVANSYMVYLMSELLSGKDTNELKIPKEEITKRLEGKNVICSLDDNNYIFKIVDDEK